MVRVWLVLAMVVSTVGSRSGASTVGSDTYGHWFKFRFHYRSLVMCRTIHSGLVLTVGSDSRLTIGSGFS